MSKRMIYEEYDSKTQYAIVSTGAQVAQSSLTGALPVKGEERILFYSMWLIIPEKGNNGHDKLLTYNIKDVIKIKSLTAKKNHYRLFTGINQVIEPQFHHGWQARGYIGLLGKRSEGDLKGYILWIGDNPYVMGVWPIENRTLYEQTDINKLQSLLEREINAFTKPKLWKAVYMFNHPI
jgi:hypothetical protein